MEMQDNVDGKRSRETANILESLANLIYLARLEADHPDRVRQYMDLSEERMLAMANILLPRC